mgnify:CR=1 FL=1
MIVPMGSLVKVLSPGRQTTRVLLPDGRTAEVQSSDIQRVGSKITISSIVREVIGCPYIWGGKSTFGFDCSGLVQFIFDLLGIRLPRDSKDQATVGKRVSSLRSLMPLDLVFFGKGSNVDHVAIHWRDLAILHCSGYVRFESLRSGDKSFRKDLRAGFAVARRILGQ